MSKALAESKELVSKLQAMKTPMADERQALFDELEAALDGPRAGEAAVREKIKAIQLKIKPIDEALSSADGVKFIRDDDIRAQIVKKITAQIGG